MEGVARFWDTGLGDRNIGSEAQKEERILGSTRGRSNERSRDENKNLVMFAPVPEVL
ncbi:hypothetical protein scyTo_0008107, partial [Scyliorhinus torazame]|nr:hypothetical protein [Scyliorhinus torazame]